MKYVVETITLIALVFISFQSNAETLKSSLNATYESASLDCERKGKRLPDLNELINHAVAHGSAIMSVEDYLNPDVSAPLGFAKQDFNKICHSEFGCIYYSNYKYSTQSKIMSDIFIWSSSFYQQRFFVAWYYTLNLRTGAIGVSAESRSENIFGVCAQKY